MSCKLHTVLSSRQPVLQREDDLAPGWSNTCTSSSVFDLAVFSVNPPLLFLNFSCFYTVCLSSTHRDATSDTKKRDKNLLRLIYLLLAQLVSLNFSSQTNFKLDSKRKVVITAAVAGIVPDMMFSCCYLNSHH